jgi:hypothetical protein
LFLTCCLPLCRIPDAVSVSVWGANVDDGPDGDDDEGRGGVGGECEDLFVAAVAAGLFGDGSPLLTGHLVVTLVLVSPLSLMHWMAPVEILESLAVFSSFGMRTIFGILRGLVGECIAFADGADSSRLTSCERCLLWKLPIENEALWQANNRGFDFIWCSL